MIICRVGGGLGDQFGQYNFGRYIEALTGETVYFDKSSFDHRAMMNLPQNAMLVGKNKIETIDVMLCILGWYVPTAFPNIKTPHYMDELFSASEYEAILRDPDYFPHTLPQLLKSRGLDCLYVAYWKNKGILDDQYSGKIFYPYKNIIDQMYRHRRDPVNWKKVVKSSENVYIALHMSPCSWWFYENVRLLGPQYLDEFAFRRVDNDDFNRLYAEISKNVSIGVHFRRGDLTLPEYAFMAPPNSYYRHALSIAKNETPGAMLYVFSDEIEWARKNKHSLGIDQFNDVHFVDIDTSGGSDWLDLYLMAACKSLVFGSSSFSALARLVSPNRDNRKDICWQDILNPFVPIRHSLWGLRARHIPPEIPRRFMPLLWKGMLSK